MKSQKLIKVILLAAALGLLLLVISLTGCASSRPPSGLEQHFFNVTTNYLTTIVIETNYVYFTNNLTDEVEAVTNIIQRTNEIAAYVFSPGTNANAVVETGTAIGNFWGVGGIVGTLLSLMFGAWAKMRSNTAFKTAGLLAQTIEAGRKILVTTPQGQKLENEWVAWMSKQQTEAGVILEVAKLLKTVVNNESAQLVAEQLIDLVKRSQTKN